MDRQSVPYMYCLVLGPAAPALLFSRKGPVIVGQEVLLKVINILLERSLLVKRNSEFHHPREVDRETFRCDGQEWELHGTTYDTLYRTLNLCSLQLGFEAGTLLKSCWGVAGWSGWSRWRRHDRSHVNNNQQTSSSRAIDEEKLTYVHTIGWKPCRVRLFPPFFLYTRPDLCRLGGLASDSPPWRTLTHSESQSCSFRAKLCCRSTPLSYIPIYVHSLKFQLSLRSLISWMKPYICIHPYIHM
jgi:hypothetical protein